MKKYDQKYFVELEFTKGQIQKYYENACKDFDIAKKDDILDVKFNYAYSALIKAGIALLGFHQLKVRSVPGHHIKILEYLAGQFKSSDIYTMGNVMRSKRNFDFYSGGIEVTEKECREYIQFIKIVLDKVEEILHK